MRVLVAVFFLGFLFLGWNVYIEPTSTDAMHAQEIVSTRLDMFSASVTNGSASQVVGVYAEGILALPVGQQPTNDPGYITPEQGASTQFSLPSAYGVTAILAHNYLAGATFNKLREGQVLVVVFGDGRRVHYRVREVQSFQALTPLSVYSDMRALDGTNARLTSTQLFERVYTEQGTLVLQTCIEEGGEWSWGRLFIIADPIR